MERIEDRGTRWGLVMGLILMGTVARLVPHLPNVTPLTAIALFGGAYLPRRWAIALPLATVAASDLVLGLHGLIAFTWGGFALTGLCVEGIKTTVPMRERRYERMHGL